MNFIHQSHHQKVLIALAQWLVVQTAATNAQQITLPALAQVFLMGDQGLPLAHSPVFHKLFFLKSRFLFQAYLSSGRVRPSASQGLPSWNPCLRRHARHYSKTLVSIG